MDDRPAAAIPATTRLGRAEGLLSRRTSSSVVLLGTGEDVAVLRDTAKVVWDAFDQPRTLRQVAEAIASRYDVDGSQILSDVVPFIEDLLAKGLLIVEPTEHRERRS